MAVGLSNRRYSVYVENVDWVCMNKSWAVAHNSFKDYIYLSKMNYGSAAGESVFLWIETGKDKEESKIVDSYRGELDKLAMQREDGFGDI